MLRLGREGGVFLEGILGARVFLQKGGGGGLVVKEVKWRRTL